MPLPPPPVPPGEVTDPDRPPEIETYSMDQIVGLHLYDPFNQVWGIVQGHDVHDYRGNPTGERTYQFFIPDADRTFSLGSGFTLFDPRDQRLYTPGTRGNVQSKIASSSDLERFGFSAGGTSGSTGSYAGTAAAQGAQFQHDFEMLEAQHANDLAILEAQHLDAIAKLEMELEHAEGMQKEMIQAQIDLENLRHQNNLAEMKIQIRAQRKNLLVSEIGATGRTMLQEQGATERQLLELGPDPFKQAAGLAGQVTRGITPQMGAVAGAREFIDQPIPEADFNMSIPQLQGVLGGMGGMQAPTFGGFGMKHGGTLSTKKKKSVLVGEAGPEVLTVGGGKVEVTPLIATAQAGWTMGQPPKAPPGGVPADKPWGAGTLGQLPKKPDKPGKAPKGDSPYVYRHAL
jgi:hypothetical protein